MKIRIILTLLSLMLLIPGCKNQFGSLVDCDTYLHSEVPHPEMYIFARVWVRDCGATTPTSVIVRLSEEEPDENFAIDDAIVATYEGSPDQVSLYWLADILRIEHEDLDFFIMRDKVDVNRRNVKVAFRDI